MKRNTLVLGLISGLAIACSMSVNDANPTATSVTTASMSGSGLTLNGSGLQNVTGLVAAQGATNATLGPFTTHTASLLTATLPAIFHLPAVLTIARANASEVLQLSALTSLTVDGTLNAAGDGNVTGKVAIGRQIVNNSSPCGPGFGANLCTATCPTGMVIIGGGCNVQPVSAGLAVNYPNSDTQWFCQSGSATASTVTVYAICARMN
jgi:hypothetical protein